MSTGTREQKSALEPQRSLTDIEMRDRSVMGTVLVVGSAVAYSSAGFFTRLIDLDTATLMFWRGLFAGLFMSAWIVIAYGRDTSATVRKIG